MRNLLQVLRVWEVTLVALFVAAIESWFWLLHCQATAPTLSFMTAGKVTSLTMFHSELLDQLNFDGGFPQLSFQLGGCLLCLWTTERLLSRKNKHP